MLVLSSLLARIASVILLVPVDVVEQELVMMAPLPASWQHYRHQQWVDRTLQECWSDDSAGYEIQAQDEWLVNGGKSGFSIIDDDSQSFRPSTYGEITTIGARQLFYHMGLTGNDLTRSIMPFAVPTNKEESVVFMDWGSGTGKLVAQACLELIGNETKNQRHIRLEEASGIELSSSRNEVALASKSKLLLKNTNHLGSFLLSKRLNDVLLYEHGDIFAQDTSKATHVYISSLCFTPEMMQRLEEKLARGHERLKCVATLRKFPSLSIAPRVQYLEMSWSRPKGVAVYFYDF